MASRYESRLLKQRYEQLAMSPCASGWRYAFALHEMNAAICQGDRGKAEYWANWLEDKATGRVSDLPGEQDEYIFITKGNTNETH